MRWITSISTEVLFFIFRGNGLEMEKRQRNKRSKLTNTSETDVGAARRLQLYIMKGTLFWLYPMLSPLFHTSPRHCTLLFPSHFSISPPFWVTKAWQCEGKRAAKGAELQDSLDTSVGAALVTSPPTPTTRLAGGIHCTWASAELCWVGGASATGPCTSLAARQSALSALARLLDWGGRALDMPTAR